MSLGFSNSLFLPSFRLSFGIAGYSPSSIIPEKKLSFDLPLDLCHHYLYSLLHPYRVAGSGVDVGYLFLFLFIYMIFFMAEVHSRVLTQLDICQCLFYLIIDTPKFTLQACISFFHFLEKFLLFFEEGIFLMSLLLFPLLFPHMFSQVFITLVTLQLAN